MAIQRTGRLGRARNLSKNRAFWLVAYTLFILLVGATIPTPLYPIYQDLFGFSAGVLTVVFAVYMIAALFSLIFIGPLSDRVGRRRVLLPALGLAAMGSAVFLFAQDVGWLLAARVLQGLGVGAALGTAVATLTEFEPTGDHRRATGRRSRRSPTVIGLSSLRCVRGVRTVANSVGVCGLLGPARPSALRGLGDTRDCQGSHP